MINNSKIVIALVAGETSGDVLGAGLIRAIKLRVPNVRFVGIAGPLMEKEGCEAWYRVEELSVMGIMELLIRLPRILYIRAKLKNSFIKLKPDVFIGIDSPDFNIALEINLKKNGIKTIHYVSPSIWAWRKNRILDIKRSSDLVLSILPFEKAFYDKLHIPCRFIGHILADIIPLCPDKNAARDEFNIPYNINCLAVLPGSRINEINMLSAVFIKTAQILRNIYPDLEILIPLVNINIKNKFEHIKNNIAPTFKVRLIDGNNGKFHKAIIASDAALVASGTASLECMLAKRPMVIGYRMNAITFWLAKRLIKINNISLPNIIADRKLIEEFIQDQCKPNNLASALIPLLDKSKNNQDIQRIFYEIHLQLRCNANEQAADAVFELIRY